MKLFASEPYVDEKINQNNERFERFVEQQISKVITSLKDLYTQKTEVLTQNYLSEISKLDSKISDISSVFDKFDKELTTFKQKLFETESFLFKIEKNQYHIEQLVSDIRTDLDVINHEKQDLTPVFEKIEGLDQSTLEHFKIVHDTMSKLSEIAMHKPILEKSDPRNPKESFFDRRLHKLDEKHSELASKVDAAIELIFEKLANKISDEELPSQLSGDRCPFKSKQGYCELWATRKNKADAMVYCSSCIQSSTLLDKGVRL